jgi:hypothetical protein
MSTVAQRITLGILAIGIGVLPLQATDLAFAQPATAPARCDWIGAANAPLQSLTSNQSLLRLKVDQDLGNPNATHGDEDTVQINYAYDSSFLSKFDIKAGTKLHASGYVRQGGQCVVDTLNVGTLEPGREGYIAPVGACLQPGSETIAVAEKASKSLGCAVSPPLALPSPTQPFQGGRMFYSRGIYVLQYGAAGVPTSGTWAGVRDAFRDPEPESTGLTPPAENLFEPRRGFGKTWRELYAGPDGPLGWATEDEHSGGGTWQQFENGLVVVLPSGPGFVLYYDGNTWEQRDR